MQIEPMHAARLANLEAALCGLLRQAGHDFEPNDQPDCVVVTMDRNGIDIEYRRGELPVGGEGC